MFARDGSYPAWTDTRSEESVQTHVKMNQSPPVLGGRLQEAHFNVLAQSCVLSTSMPLQVVQEWHQSGVDIDDIYLVGITQTAQLMGEWWCEDVLDFATATIAFYRLHQLLYELSPVFFEGSNAQAQGLTCCMVGEFGGQHTLGMFMLSEFFRRDGWRVRSPDCEDGSDLLRIVASDWFDVITLSISSDRQLGLFRRLIPLIRKQSANKSVRILAGGPMLALRPQGMAKLGADVLSTNAKQAQEAALRHFEISSKM